MLRIALLVLALLAGPALSHGYGQGETIVAHPYIFPVSPGGQSAAGYLTLMNNGGSVERLLEVRSPFERATLHTTIEDDGVARMRSLDVIEVPPSGQTALQPGGIHIMFMGLGETSLEVGDTFTATLVFERAGEVEVEFWVEERGDGAMEMDHSQHGHEDQSSRVVPRHTKEAIEAGLAAALQADVEIAAVAATRDAALVAWQYSAEGGRALLKRDGESWEVAVLSGDTLATQAGLAAHGLRRDASVLLAILEGAEADLPETTRAQIAGFEGTLFLR